LGLSRANISFSLSGLFGVFGDDESSGCISTDADVLPWSVGVDPTDVAGVELVALVGDGDLKVALDDIEKLGTTEDLGCELAVFAGGEELGEARDHVAVGDEGAETAGEEARVLVLFASDEDAVLVVEAVKGDLFLRLEEVGEILLEYEGDACEVAKGGHNTTCLKLGEEAGGKTSELTEFDETHGAFEAKPTNALSDELLVDLLLYTGRVHYVYDVCLRLKVSRVRLGRNCLRHCGVDLGRYFLM
jgi:hypothetical protein